VQPNCANINTAPSVADPDTRDPVLFYPLDPGSGSRMNFFLIPDPGSRIPDPEGIGFLVRSS
jgi:hypothetical protein